ncbi:MAG: hypothetical protein HY726_15650 [Candidatus Rokubacteria bacterium]|nr:hypothetical protein [Candidatus Rokubacteria bacterium]
MKRVATLLTIVALAPLLMGAGGELGTPVPSNFVSVEAFGFRVTLDTHEPADSTTAKVGFISIRDKHGRTADSTFLSTGPYFLGCRTDLTVSRFVQTSSGSRIRLQAWMDSDLVTALFAQLGTQVDNANRIPAISQLTINVCMNQPLGTTAGWLLMEGTIEIFAAPK